MQDGEFLRADRCMAWRLKARASTYQLMRQLHRLWKQDNDFQLRQREVAGNVGGKVAASDNRFPGGSRLVQAEILAVQLHGNGTRWTRYVRERDPRKCLLDEMFYMVGRTDLNQIRRPGNQVSFGHLGA